MLVSKSSTVQNLEQFNKPLIGEWTESKTGLCQRVKMVLFKI
jgi:hypothetical protein